MPTWNKDNNNNNNNNKILCLNFSGISGNLEQKNILQTTEQLIQFSHLLLQKEIFLMYSFCEQVEAKENSSETTW